MNNLQFKLNDYRLNRLVFSIRPGVEVKGAVPLIPALKCNHLVKSERMIEVVASVAIGGEQMPFSIEVSYQSNFEFNQDIKSIEKDERNKIVNVNCIAYMLPFFRETIAEITRKAGFQPLVLPTINFLEVYEKWQKSKNLKLKTRRTHKASLGNNCFPLLSNSKK